MSMITVVAIDVDTAIFTVIVVIIIVILIIMISIIILFIIVFIITLDVAPGKGGCGNLLSEVGLSSGPSTSLLQAASLLLLLAKLGCLQPLH